MASSILLLFPFLFNLGVLSSVSGSPAVEKAYAAVVGTVSPGEQYLTGQSVRTLFNTLEKRVQCGEVSCGKVSFINSAAKRKESLSGAGAVERGRGPKAINHLHLLLPATRDPTDKLDSLVGGFLRFYILSSIGYIYLFDFDTIRMNK